MLKQEAARIQYLLKKLRNPLRLKLPPKTTTTGTAADGGTTVGITKILGMTSPPGVTPSPMVPPVPTETTAAEKNPPKIVEEIPNDTTPKGVSDKTKQDTNIKK